MAEPMFDMGLFRIRAFSAGNLAGLLAALACGGLLVTAIIGLQGIYLPCHGHGFSQTPLWAGLYLLPLPPGSCWPGRSGAFRRTIFGARPCATAGLVAAAVSFLPLDLLPVDFAYGQFALVMLLTGIGVGLFTSPNPAGVMNSLPPGQRGAGAGMAQTFQNSGTVLSIGIVCTLIIAGLAGPVPARLLHGLTAHGVPGTAAARVASPPPASVLFASLLGYHPVRTLLGPVPGHLPPAQAAFLTSRGFFPTLISPAFAQGLPAAFGLAAGARLIAALASLLRGGRYVYGASAGSTGPPGAATAAWPAFPALARAGFTRIVR